uniref:Uncharacterized protein n=1 Tax=Arundo donax TaxID=35708 RepID=A0A0A8XNG7_ARUDO
MAAATDSAVPPLLSTPEFDFDGMQACCARIQAACAKILADLETKREEEGHQPVAAASPPAPPTTAPSPTLMTPPDGAKTLPNPCCIVRCIMHGQVDAPAILGGREESLWHAGSLPWPRDSLTWGC